MLHQCDISCPLFEYCYIDLEGKKFGPFKGSKMAEWDKQQHFDDELIIFRISASGKTERFVLGDLKRRFKWPFLEFDCLESLGSIASDVKDKNTKKEISDSSLKKDSSIIIAHGDLEPSKLVELSRKAPVNRKPGRPITRVSRSKIESILAASPMPVMEIEGMKLMCRRREYSLDLYPPLMRLPDHRGAVMKPEAARSKIFHLYQLIISVPWQLRDFPPYTEDSARCQLCHVHLIGPQIFNHLIEIQHLTKISSCLFTEHDIDYWIHRLQNVIKLAPAKAISICGFEPKLNVNETESVASFINRTKGFKRRPNAEQIGKPMNIISVILDVEVATTYAVSASNKSKRKLSGNFVSRVVESLIDGLDRRAFKRRLSSSQKILEKHNTKCDFCLTQLDTFYDVCQHIASLKHREQISNIHYDEGLVATWVRLLAPPVSRSQASASSNGVSMVSSSSGIL